MAEMMLPQFKHEALNRLRASHQEIGSLWMASLSMDVLHDIVPVNRPYHGSISRDNQYQILQKKWFSSSFGC